MLDNLLLADRCVFLYFGDSARSAFERKRLSNTPFRRGACMVKWLDERKTESVGGPPAHPRGNSAVSGRVPGSGMQREFCRSRGLCFGTLDRHLKKQRWKRKSRSAPSAGRSLSVELAARKSLLCSSLNLIVRLEGFCRISPTAPPKCVVRQVSCSPLLERCQGSGSHSAILGIKDHYNSSHLGTALEARRPPCERRTLPGSTWVRNRTGPCRGAAPR